MREVAGDRLARLQVAEDRPRPGTALLSVEPGPDCGHQLCDRISLAIASGAGELVVDFSSAHSVDPMTLGVLRAAVARVRSRGGRLRLIAGRELRRAFESALAGEPASVHGTREEALAAGPAVAGSLRAVRLS